MAASIPSIPGSTDPLTTASQTAGLAAHAASSPPAPSTSDAGGSAHAAPAPAPAAPVSPDTSDLRLVIVDDPKTGGFVYMTVNWQTREIVSQIPREQLANLSGDQTYVAGGVVDTTA